MWRETYKQQGQAQEAQHGSRLPRICCVFFWLLCVMGSVSCGEEGTMEALDAEEGQDLLTHQQALRAFAEVQGEIASGGFCQVEVKRFGRLDLEKDYLPRVVWCENREAPEASFEALKAQAIAARTYALYRVYDYTSPGALDPGHGTASQSDQSYDCGTPSGASWERAQRAVAQTSGQVFINATTGHIVWGCYASGADRDLRDATCRATSSHYTERHMTRNQGRAWGAPGFSQTTLGGVSPSSSTYNNHGCMGQKEANCLASAQGKSASEILRYFYGNVRLVQLDAPCFQAANTVAAGDRASSGVPPTTSSSQPVCNAPSQRPQIVSRSEWGAQSYRGAPAPLGQPQRITIHHAAGSVVSSGGVAEMRSVQDYHMRSNGWDDIGYHYVIMPDGKIYKGRADYRAGEYAMGAHVGGHNANNLGVMLYGNFERQDPTRAQLASAGQLVAWLAKTHDLKIERGRTLFGHRDFGGSLCPGARLHDDLEEIARHANSEKVCVGGAGGRGSAPERTFLPTPEIDLPDTIYPTIELINTSSSDFYLDAIEIYRGGDRAMIEGLSLTEQEDASINDADNAGCGAPETTAIIRPGEIFTISLSEAIRGEDVIKIKQYASDVPAAGCAFDGVVDVRGVSTETGSAGRILKGGGTQNFEFTVSGPTLTITAPKNHTSSPQEGVRLESEASAEIVKVEYYAELYPLGSSTAAMEHFGVPYSFSQTGRRIITAKGYDQEGSFVAADQIEIEVGEGGFVLDGLEDGGVYPPSLRFEARLSQSALMAAATRAGVSVDALGVRCTADGFALPVVPDKPAALSWQAGQGAFSIQHTFTQQGVRAIVCEIFSPDDKALLSTRTLPVTILEGASGLEILAPKHRGWYRRDRGIEFLARALDPRIVRVDYVADGKWKFGESTDAASDFAFPYLFTHYGTRRIVAQGYSGDGMVLAQQDIYITLTDDSGAVPKGSADVINQNIPDAPSQTAPATDVSPTPTQPDSSPDLTNRRALACAILEHHRAGRLNLWNDDPQGDAPGTAYNNIKDTCDGKRASNSRRGHLGPVRVDLNMKVLRLVYDMPSSGFVFAINWFAGGRHGQGSQHYSGQAVDTGGLIPGGSFTQLNACDASSQVGRANRWIWSYGIEHGSNQTLSICGNSLSGPPRFGFLGHSTWAHSAWR